jgi:hypothetical protein
MIGRTFRTLMAGIVLGATALGCGGTEEGAPVKVDKEKEAEITKAMERYYMKKDAPAKSGTAEPAEKKAP